MCRKFNFFIAREIKNDVKDEAVAAKIMAHAMDESTDIAMESGLIQYIKHVRKNGLTVTKFWSLNV